MRTSPYARPEPTTRAGDVLLSHNHIALLHGLYDRPGGRAPSSADFISSAVPYVALFRDGVSIWVIRKSLRTLHPAWATRRRSGRNVTWRLTKRGRAIVEGVAPARIRGLGPYKGLAPLRYRAALERNPALVESRWKRAVNTPALAVLTAAADAVVVAWSRQDNRIGMGHALMRHYQRTCLSLYVRRHVLLNGSLPTGPRVVAKGLCVDFDELTLKQDGAGKASTPKPST